MEELFEKASRDRAKNRIERLKSLYTHCLIYITVNVLTFVAGLIGFGMHPVAWKNCLIGTLSIGGLGVLIHTMIVFGPSLLKGRGWEEREMHKLLKEEQDKNNTNPK